MPDAFYERGRREQYQPQTPESEPIPVPREVPETASRREVFDAFREIGEVPSAPARVAEPASPVPLDPAAALVPVVQSILAEGLEETYAQLPEPLRSKFKSEGERTASVVAKLLTDTKIQLNRVILLIRKWLSIIPGVNRYYLEQEAKLKADALLAAVKTRS